MQGTAGGVRTPRPGLHGPLQPCTSEPSLDPGLFDALSTTLDRAVLAQIYREFLAQTRSRIEEHAARLDSPALRSLGHTLKGTAGMLGAQALANCAVLLEAEAADPARAEQVLHAMLAACAALEAALRERQIPL